MVTLEFWQCLQRCGKKKILSFDAARNQQEDNKKGFKYSTLSRLTKPIYFEVQA